MVFSLCYRILSLILNMFFNNKACTRKYHNHTSLPQRYLHVTSKEGILKYKRSKVDYILKTYEGASRKVQLVDHRPKNVGWKNMDKINGWKNNHFSGIKPCSNGENGTNMEVLVQKKLTGWMLTLKKVWCSVYFKFRSIKM